MKRSGTENELVDLIKSTLDGYEEQYILGSWENFVRHNKKKRRIIYWLTASGIAATIMIGWIGFRFLADSQGKDNKEILQQYISNVEQPTGKNDQKAKLVTPLNPVISSNDNNRNKEFQTPGNENITPGKLSQEVSTRTYTEDILNDTSVIRPEQALPINPVKINPAQLIAGFNSSQELNSSTGIRDLTIQIRLSPEKAGNETEEQIKPGLLSDDNLNVEKGKDKLRFGVGVASGVTVTNTSSSPNFSGGINAEYSLFSRFRISTGIQIEQQNVMNEASDSPEWIPPEELQARLVDIDIPINLTWKFLARKSTGFYLSGGISSVLFLSEKYTSTTYSQKLVPTVESDNGASYVSYQIENVKSTSTFAESPLSTFNFAQRINIIIGLEHQISSGLLIHVEPYLKLPVSDLAAQNIKYTIGGVALRISF